MGEVGEVWSGVVRLTIETGLKGVGWMWVDYGRFGKGEMCDCIYNGWVSMELMVVGWMR